jgi:hypothetical protein
VASSGRFRAAKLRVLGVNDNAYDEYDRSGRPATLVDDSNGRVFRAYQALALKLAATADALCETYAPRVS